MSCLETYATLRIFSASQHPEEIGRILGVHGTLARPLNLASRYRHVRESHYWAWSTKELKQSTDGLEHVGAVIDVLHGKESQLQQLRDLGCEIDVSCYWVSSGQGGPLLDRQTLSALAHFDLEIWWDVYFADSSEHSSPDQQTPAPSD